MKRRNINNVTGDYAGQSTLKEATVAVSQKDGAALYFIAFSCYHRKSKNNSLVFSGKESTKKDARLSANVNLPMLVLC